MEFIITSTFVSSLQYILQANHTISLHYLEIFSVPLVELSDLGQLCHGKIAHHLPERERYVTIMLFVFEMQGFK